MELWRSVGHQTSGYNYQILLLEPTGSDFGSNQMGYPVILGLVLKINYPNKLTKIRSLILLNLEFPFHFIWYLGTKCSSWDHSFHNCTVK